MRLNSYGKIKQDFQSLKTDFGFLDKFTIIYLIIFASLSVGLCDWTNEIIGLLMVIWFFAANHTDKSSLKKSLLNSPLLFLYCYMFYIIALGWISGNFFYNLKISISTFLQFSPLLIYKFYNQNNSLNKLKLFGKILLYVWILLSLVSILYSLGINDIGRAITSGSYKGSLPVVGGINLANASAILTVFLLDLLKRKVYSLISKNRIIIFVLIEIVSVILSGSTISMVCMLIGIIILFIPKSKKGRIVSILCLIISVLFRKRIGILMINIGAVIRNKVTSDRIISLGTAIAYGASNSDASYFFSRIERPILSLKTFLSNPIFGVAHQYGNYYPKAYEYGIGCHGEWADLLGKYGLFSLTYFSTIVLSLCDTGYRKRIVCLLVFFLIGCFNPVLSFSIAIIMFLLIPAMDIN